MTTCIEKEDAAVLVVLYLGAFLLLGLGTLLLGINLARLHAFWSFSAAITRRLWATPEAEIIRSSRDVLSAIDSPKELATTLYGKGLIDFHTKERIHQLPLTLTEQRERLLDAVENQCRTNSRTFHEFVTVLKQEPTTQYVACLLQKSHKEIHLTNQLRGTKEHGHPQQSKIGIPVKVLVGTSIIVIVWQVASIALLSAVLGTSAAFLLCIWKYWPTIMSTRDTSKESEGSFENLKVVVDNCKSLDRPVVAVLGRELPLRRLCGPCAGKTFHRTQKLYIKWILLNQVDTVNQATRECVRDSRIPVDIQVLALCYQALCKAIIQGKLEEASALFEVALKRAQQPECVNGEMLQGRVLQNYASLLRTKKEYEKAQACILQAKQKMWLAAPSFDQAGICLENIHLKLHYMPKNQPTGSPSMIDIENDFEFLLQQQDYLEEYEQPAICLFLTRKARFHLRSSDISDELPPLQCEPNSEDIRKAEACLKRVPLTTLPGEVNFYAAEYDLTRSDLYLWKHQYQKAIECAEEAKQKFIKGNITGRLSCVPKQRIKLLKELQKQDSQGDAAVNAILDTYN